MNSLMKRLLGRNRILKNRVSRARRKLKIELLEGRRVMAGDFQNPVNQYDVDSDGHVSPLDYLVVVNFLNANPPSKPVFDLPPPPITPYLDVNGNDTVDSLDVLSIYNQLNGLGSSGYFAMMEIQYEFSVNRAGSQIVLDNLSPQIYVGETLYVDVKMRDPRGANVAPGIFSTYSDLIFGNSDGSSVDRLRLLESGVTWMNPFVNGQYFEQAEVNASTTKVVVGGFSNSTTPTGSNWASVFRVPLVATNSGVVDIEQRITEHESIGLSLFDSELRYLDSNEVILARAKLTVLDSIMISNDQASSFEDTLISINVLANDESLVDGGLIITEVTQPGIGGAVGISDDSQRIQFEPSPNYFGQVLFTYTAENSLGVAGTGTVTIDIVPVNDAPNARSDQFDASNTTETLLDVLANDDAGAYEIDDSIRIVSVSNPSNSGATVTISDGMVLYAPVPGYIGQDQFSYVIEDLAGLRSVAIVELFVSPPSRPYAIYDMVTIVEDADFPADIDVLLNDLANPGATKRLLSFSQPNFNFGTVTLNDNGTPSNLEDDILSYDAPPDFYGTSVFTYTMIDSTVDNDPNTLPSTASVTVMVLPVNDPPVAAGRSANATEDITLVIPGSAITSGLSRGPQEDSQSLTITSAVIDNPENGIVSIVDGNIEYVPTENFFGNVFVVYTVTDNGVTGTSPDPLSANGTLTITVDPVNDVPNARRDYFNVSNIQETLLDVLANDDAGAYEADDSIRIVSVSNPSSSGATVTISDGRILYQPVPGYIGQDQFSYVIEDLSGMRSNAIVELHARPPLQNPGNRFDVDANGSVDFFDYDRIASFLSIRGPVDQVTSQLVPPDYLDVDGDNLITPLDGTEVLAYLDSIRNPGPREVASAAIRYEYFAINPDGSLGRNLDPIPNDNISEANVLQGEKFVVRTLIKDTRTRPYGVLSTYSNFHYTNLDASSAEKIEIQSSETQAIGIDVTAREGSFRISDGNDISPPVKLHFTAGGELDEAAIAKNIQDAISGLPGIGIGNVSVQWESNRNRAFLLDPRVNEYRIVFKNQLARTDVPSLIVVENQMTTGGDSPEPAGVYSLDVSPSSPDDKYSLQAAMRRSQIPWPAPLYVDNAYGVWSSGAGSSPAERVLFGVGGTSMTRMLFLQQAGYFPFDTQPQDWVLSQEMIFEAKEAGDIKVHQSLISKTNDPADIDELGVLLVGANPGHLEESQVVLPEGIIRIHDRFTAVKDRFSIFTDGPMILDVLHNDLRASGVPIQIAEVTNLQPSNAGSLTLQGGELSFVASPGFQGQASFDYKVRTSDGQESTASVLLVFGEAETIPTLNPIQDVVVPFDVGRVNIPLDGISSGNSNSNALRIQVTTDTTQHLSRPVVNYVPGEATGSIELSTIDAYYETGELGDFGTTSVTVFIENGGTDGVLETLADNQIVERKFRVIITPPATYFQNSSNPYDVNWDGSVSPYDIEVSRFPNLMGPSQSTLGLDSVANRADQVFGYYDVNGDEVFSALDTLAVINYLNNGDNNPPAPPEKMLSLAYEFFALNSDGTIGRNLDPNPSDDIKEAKVFVGEQFIVRTLAKDERTGGQGVFSTYSNLVFENLDRSPEFKIVPQWSEISIIDFQTDIVGSSAVPGFDWFQLNYGGEVTGPIRLEFSSGGEFLDYEKTAANLERAIASLPSVGIGNVRVEYDFRIPTGFKPTSQFLIRFQNELANFDLPDLTVVNNHVTIGGEHPQIVPINVSGLNALSRAIPYSPFSFVLNDRYNRSFYSHFQSDNDANPWVSTIESFGGVLNGTSVSNPGQWNTIREALFDAKGAGLIQLSDGVAEDARDSQGNQVGISMLGWENRFLAADQINLPTGVVQVLQGLIANDDQYSINQDSGIHSFEVLNNDVNNRGEAWQIVSITQPVGGSVELNSNGSSIRFTPSFAFSGETEFSYIVGNASGDRSIATVKVLVLDVDNPPTLNDISDIQALLDIEQIVVGLSGIGPGLGDNQEVRVFAVSSSSNVITSVNVDFQFPSTEGTLRLSKGLIEGTSVITVTVEDSGFDGDFSTVGDNQKFSQSFAVHLSGNDFGDAPSKLQTGFASSYPVLLADDGARHAVSLLALGGIAIDAEHDGKPSLMALGDDEAGRDDENGISFPITSRTSQSSATKASYIASSTLDGFIDAWIDFNQDGDWDDLGEKISDRIAVKPGTNMISYVIPAGSLPGVTYSRFRISSEGGLSPRGEAVDGEVEDYAIEFTGDANSTSEVLLDDIGDFQVNVVNGRLTISVGGAVIWDVPATEPTSLRFRDSSGNVVGQLSGIAENFPGVVKYENESGNIQLDLHSLDFSLTEFDAANLDGVNIVDLRNTKDNSLSFEKTDIEKLNGQNQLFVRMEKDDSLVTTSPWIPIGGEVISDRWVQHFQSGIAVLKVQSEREWRNEANRFDVDGDTDLNPLDVLFLVNRINIQPEGTVKLPPRTASAPIGFVDPDGDNYMTPLDVLMLINGINSSSLGESEGEGERSPLQPTSLNIATSDAALAELWYTPDWEDFLNESDEANVRKNLSRMSRMPR